MTSADTNNMLSLALMTHPEISRAYISAASDVLRTALDGAHADHVQRYAESAGLGTDAARLELTAAVPGLKAARAAAEQAWFALLRGCDGDNQAAIQLAQNEPWLRNYASHSRCTAEQTVLALSQLSLPPACAA